MIGSRGVFARQIEFAAVESWNDGTAINAKAQRSKDAKDFELLEVW